MEIASMHGPIRHSFSPVAITGPLHRRVRGSPRLQARHLAAIDAFIDARIEQVLRIDDLAGVVGLSRFHFLRCFKHATGSSPLQYILARRVAHAQLLLRSSAQSIAEIAYAAGFSSQSHLNSTFKRLCGTTPGAYLRAHRTAPIGT